MSQTTYFVVQPFEMSKRGRLIACNPVPAQSAGQAVRLAERQLPAKTGAIAFSRTGDPETGDFEDAVVLGTFGQVPEDVLSA